MDRDQLVALVQRLANHAPALEELALLPLPGERRRLDPSIISRQVSQVLGSMPFTWRAAGAARRELWPIVELGTRYLAEGAIQDARAVFVAIIETIQAWYERIWDEESQIAEIADQCAEGLERCLGQSSDPVEREALLRDLFAVYRWDSLDHGGYGMSRTPERVLLSCTTPEERQRVAVWVREALPRGELDHGRWHRQCGGQLVLALVGAPPAEQDRERLYVEASLDGHRMDLLLAQGRVEEAAAMVRDAHGEALLELADRLIAAGLVAAAEAAVADHGAVVEYQRDEVRGWLAQRGVATPANLDALVEALRWFQVQPLVSSYERLRAEAQAAGRWPAVLQVTGEFGNARKLQPLRARICAELGEAASALDELEGLTGSTWNRTALEVPRALESSHPDVAVGLYMALLEALVAHGTKPARLQAEELRARLASLAGCGS